MKVESFPPYIYVPIPWVKAHQNYRREAPSLGNLSYSKLYFSPPSCVAAAAVWSLHCLPVDCNLLSRTPLSDQPSCTLSPSHLRSQNPLGEFTVALSIFLDFPVSNRGPRPFLRLPSEVLAAVHGTTGRAPCVLLAPVPISLMTSSPYHICFMAVFPLEK
jgi:hypothetical protein